MRIAYLINTYPKISHVFIRREILAIEQRGIEVVRIAIRGWDSELVDDVDRLERDRTRYVLREGGVKLLVAVTRLLVTRPRRLIRALVMTWHMSRQSARPLPVHLIYLAEACWIALLIRAMHVSHVHAHFGTNSANVAMLVHELGGPSWSFTVHGPEEFDLAPIIGLKEKINRCAFVVAISSYGRSQLYRLLEYNQWGKVYVIDSVQGQIIKRVFQYEDNEKILLVSDNKEKYPPFPINKSDIRSLSIVLGAVRME